jgi:heme exporter protein C
VTSQPSAIRPDDQLVDTDTDTDTDADADGSVGTGSRATRILGLLTLAGIALATYLALVASPPSPAPPDGMGDVVRILYVHVPIVTMAYVGCGLTTLGSVMYLWKKSVWWDITAAASAEVAMVFTALTLVIGMIWARPTWGAWWVWDGRLTSTAMLLLLLLGYLAVRRLPAEAATRSKRSAIVGVLLVPNVYIVNRSVTWWRSLHQGSTLGLQPKIEGLMFFSLMFAMFVAALLFAWLLIHRWRLVWLEEQLDAHELDRAILERRAEAAAGSTPATIVPPTTSGSI